jgi:hypothetical protein
VTRDHPSACESVPGRRQHVPRAQRILGRARVAYRPSPDVVRVGRSRGNHGVVDHALTLNASVDHRVLDEIANRAAHGCPQSVTTSPPSAQLGCHRLRPLGRRVTRRCALLPLQSMGGRSTTLPSCQQGFSFPATHSSQPTHFELGDDPTELADRGHRRLHSMPQTDYSPLETSTRVSRKRVWTCSRLSS